MGQASLRVSLLLQKEFSLFSLLFWHFNTNYSVKPVLDGIRGNDTTGIARLEVPETSPRSRSLPVPVPDYTEFMREYLAQNFACNETPNKFLRQLQGRSDQVAVLGLGLKTQSDLKKPIELDLEGQSDGQRKDTMKAALEDIELALQTPRMHHSETSESEKSQLAPFMSSEVRVDAVRDAKLTRGPRPVTPRSDRRLTLSEVRNRLTPRQGCDENFFQSCSESFISDSEIWSYMTEDCVRLILNECEPGSSTNEREDIADLAKTICGMPSSKTDTEFISYRKVFAILILMKMHNKIRDFISEQIHDNLLPLKYEGSHKNPSAILVPGSNTCNPCFEGWDTADAKSFLEWQMQFCAPFFKQGKRSYHYTFPSKIALPFLSLPNSRPGQDGGGSGMVTKVELPQGHGDLQTFVRSL